MPGGASVIVVTRCYHSYFQDMGQLIRHLPLGRQAPRTVPANDRKNFQIYHKYVGYIIMVE